MLTTARRAADADEARAPKVVETPAGRLTAEQAADPLVRGHWDPDLWRAGAPPSAGRPARTAEVDR